MNLSHGITPSIVIPTRDTPARFVNWSFWKFSSTDQGPPHRRGRPRVGLARGNLIRRVITKADTRSATTNAAGEGGPSGPGEGFRRRTFWQHRNTGDEEHRSRFGRYRHREIDGGKLFGDRGHRQRR